MNIFSLRHATLLASSLALAACGAHDGSPKLPTSYDQARVSTLTAQGASTSGVEMQAASVSPPPPGFKMVIRANPRPGADGIIRGESPLTVEFDLCDSTADADKTLFFYYDWDFNNVGDAGGTGTACKQEHAYRTPAVQNPLDETLRTNICIANADIGAHNPKTFVACRQYTVVLPQRQQTQAGGNFCHEIGFDACPTQATQFCVDTPIVQTNSDQARAACEACNGKACVLSDGDCAGLGWGFQANVNDIPNWGYEAGCSGEPGRVWPYSHSFDTFGRWAP